MSGRPPRTDLRVGSVIRRTEPHLVRHDGAWWVVGGRRADGDPSGRVDRIVGDDTEPGPSLPRDWQPAAVVGVGASLWAIAGTRRPHEPVATVRVLDPGESEWAPAPRLPRPLRAAGVIATGQGVLGGRWTRGWRGLRPE